MSLALLRRWRRRSHTGPAGRSIAASAAIVAAAFALSRVLGMVREVVIAGRYGTGPELDAYLAAFRIPDLLFAVVMSGAFGSAFIPVFGGFLADGDDTRAWRLANTLLTWIVVVFLVVAQAVLWLAPWLVDGVIAPELPPETRALAVDLTRLLLLSPLLLGLGAAAKGMLEAQDAFTLPAVAPVLYNLGIILGAALLAPIVGIHGLVIGVLVGAFAHAAVQFAGLFRRGLRIRPSLSPRTDGVGAVARLLGPRLVGQGASQANLVVMTNLASRLGEGSIATLSFAQHLVLLPHGILAMSLSTVIFPRMTRQVRLGQIGAMRATLVGGLGPLLLLVVPATVLLAVFRTSIVQVLFQFGAFSAASTALVADATGWIALGLLARALIEPVTRAFYAMHDTRTPVVIAIAAIVANILLGRDLSARMGIDGLALALSITYTLRMAVLIGVLSRRTGGLAGDLARSLARMLAPAAVLVVASLALMDPLAVATDPASGRGPSDYALLAGALALCGGVYLGAAWALRVPEARQIAAIVRRRLSRGP